MPIIGAWGYPKKDRKLKLHETRSQTLEIGLPQMPIK